MAHLVAELAVATLRPMAERAAREVLHARLDASTVETVLDDAWGRYRALEAEIPTEPTLGADVMVHLSAYVVGIYRALVAAGLDEADAREWTARAVWPIYEAAVKPAWRLTAGRSRTPVERAARTMRTFFRFPYASPGYEMQEVDAGEGVFGFDVRRCPMADFFAAQGLSDLCQRACCDLDFPLAESWGTRLEVAETISRGADRCTFRFHPKDDDEPR